MTISLPLAILAGRGYYPHRGSGGIAHMIEHALIWSTVSHLVGHYLPQVGFGVAAVVLVAVWAASRLRGAVRGPGERRGPVGQPCRRPGFGLAPPCGVPGDAA